MIISPHPAGLEKSGLHAPTWWATEQEYCTILYWAIVANKYQNILEIGTFMGFTTWWLVEAAKKTEGYVITVDIVQKCGLDNLRYLHKVQSTSDEFFFGGDKYGYDFVYVDGGHSEQEAYNDIINAKKALRPGGMIAIHDTSIQQDGIKEVRRAVERAKAEIGGSWWHLEQGKGLTIAEF